jgi:hypothetical protein
LYYVYTDYRLSERDKGDKMSKSELETVALNEAVNRAKEALTNYKAETARRLDAWNHPVYHKGQTL